MKGALKNLSLFNDVAERALALATSINGKMTRDEESYQDPALVVEQHGAPEKYGLKTKSDLKKLL